MAYYYLVDLDTSDSYWEIALADWGNSDWLTTHFFRFDGADLTYLGWASGLPDDHTTQFHGDGSITAMTRLDVMQTWSGLRTYRLENDGRLEGHPAAGTDRLRAARPQFRSTHPFPRQHCAELPLHRR